ncbi:Ger(x)C family spore germination protein [Aneurinibacillus terranovensis]|uniref:Ger(x)C family spore germination protein n=1 Tax=Aneurinibacillus terranovensis TaxID=278991 RepID=UPI0004266748|nr:Ger(x)C family spore germination protein [Aneurinibacillus terranovensis]
MIKRFFILFLLCFMLTGCWDRHEINDVAFVIATGIDKVKNQYQVSFQIPLPSQLGGAGSKGGGGGTAGGNKNYYLDAARDTTVSGAIRKQQESLSRLLNFSHRRVLLIGEALAKSGVQESLDVVARNSINRLNAFLVVTKGQARDLLNADAPIEQFPAEMVRELAQGATKRPYTTKDFIEAQLSPGNDSIAPYFSVVKSNPGPKGKPQTMIKLDGFAVFNGDRETGVLKEEQATALLIAMNQARSPFSVKISPPSGKGSLDVLVTENNTQITPVMEQNQMKIRILFRGKGAIVENQSLFDIDTSGEQLDKLQQMTNRKFKSIMQQTINDLQNKYQSDPAGFGEAIYRKYPHVWHESLEKDWKTHYRNLQISVESLVRLENMGTINSSTKRKEGDAQ